MLTWSLIYLILKSKNTNNDIGCLLTISMISDIIICIEIADKLTNIIIRYIK